ncbi:polysaccharide deacetylase family protein [Mitsuokella jalaludinii]|uniref:polysaccharide deacetylase family protein n=1 Tax=Mitsuokella jalaludinii TaxID=187979 RepID=UPI00298CAEAA|nr:polysaccharide deacetylase family protein [Mitsuokella jalaludinii]
MRKKQMIGSIVLGMMMTAACSLPSTPAVHAAASQEKLVTQPLTQKPAVTARSAAVHPAVPIPQEVRVALARNQGRQAEKWRFIPSTHQSVIFTFGGLSKKEPLVHVLDEMKGNGMHGTFFVTERELKRNAENIRLIQSYGQDLGIGLTSIKGGGTAAEYAMQIRRVRDGLQQQYGVTVNIVRQMASSDNEAGMREAASAMKCWFVGQGLNAVQSKDKQAQSADEVMPHIFGKWTTSLNRNEIVYIRTDYYEKPDLAAEVMMAIKHQKVDNIAYAAYGDNPEDNEQNDSAYQIVSVQDVLAHPAELYQYPVESMDLPIEMQLSYGAKSITRTNFRQEFLKRYIGAPEVGATDRMLGFSQKELALADKTGLVKTAAPQTVFLTFDDWGNDDSINKLLYVLRKHRVHATFFVITKNMVHNPNLLRAIVADGNEVGSHTDHHVPMLRVDEKGRSHPIEDDETYRLNVRSSYEKLLEAIGDMTIEGGRPGLTRLMRPPQLAISRNGCAVALDEGFTYLVSGSGSAEDYGAVSMESLEGIMDHIVHKRNGDVRRGAIMIMHMSGTAARTPYALDLLLTKNDQRPEGDPKKFKVGLLGDYLIDGYDQRMVTPKDMREKQIDF